MGCELALDEHDQLMKVDERFEKEPAIDDRTKTNRWKEKKNWATVDPWKQVNELQETDFSADGNDVTKRVSKLLTGDLKFLSTIGGHRGAAASNNCVFCLHVNSRNLLISNWNPAKRPQLRTFNQKLPQPQKKSGKLLVELSAEEVLADQAVCAQELKINDLNKKDWGLASSLDWQPSSMVVDALLDAFPSNSQNVASRKSLYALYQVQKLAKAAYLIEATRKTYRTVTEKLHILSSHVMDFVMAHGTWEKRSSLRYFYHLHPIERLPYPSENMSFRFLFIAIITADTFSVASGVEWCKRPMMCYASGCAVPDECAVPDCFNTEAPIYVENLASTGPLHSFLERARQISTLTIIGNAKPILPYYVTEIVHEGTGPAVTLKNAKFLPKSFKNLEKITVDDPYFFCDVENKLIDIEGYLVPVVKVRLEKVANQTLAVCDKPRPDTDAQFSSLVDSPLESPPNISEQGNVSAVENCYEYDEVLIAASSVIGFLLIICILMIFVNFDIYRRCQSARGGSRKRGKRTRTNCETVRKISETARESNEKAPNA
ncbi:unnamed protein product [Caenorhabditis auriculariae]|uniref:Uncharacterized protein n=1 Tax=Caenorhabditis auriculariae TaxID=2777116 RepID=A0A8S1GSF8_9PELO|nr:unnamed protein product [Caenorhabditis auriculariae]